MFGASNAAMGASRTPPLAIAGLLFIARARADVPSAPPSWLEGKPHLDAEDLAKKVEGSYPTAVPLLDADPDTGYGGGARAYYYWNGDRSDPLFDYTPYRHRVYVQGFITNKGYQDHQVDYEWLYVAGSPFRFRITALYAANAAANYFGVGSDSMRDLVSPATGQRYARYSRYADALRQVDATGQTYAVYNQYKYQNPQVRSKVERDLLGALVRVQGGLEVGYVKVGERTGERVSAESNGSDVTALAQPTKLREDCALRRIVGCGGGWNNSLKLGVAFDTRDFEPDPNSGVFVDLSADIGTRVLGSSFDYLRVTFSPRAYVSPAPKLADVVIAARFVVSGQTSGTPFFALDTLSFTTENQHGLGGSRTIRGYRFDRFVGPVDLLANIEVRWTMFDVKVLEQRFSFALVPFFDIGRVFDSFRDLTLLGWRHGQGAGLRVAWNQSTVGAFDLGFSGEDTAFYTEFNHPF
jgi:hypothetical protein